MYSDGTSAKKPEMQVEQERCCALGKEGRVSKGWRWAPASRAAGEVDRSVVRKPEPLKVRTQESSLSWELEQVTPHSRPVLSVGPPSSPGGIAAPAAATGRWRGERPAPNFSKPRKEGTGRSRCCCGKWRSGRRGPTWKRRGAAVELPAVEGAGASAGADGGHAGGASPSGRPRTRDNKLCLVHRLIPEVSV